MDALSPHLTWEITREYAQVGEAQLLGRRRKEDVWEGDTVTMDRGTDVCFTQAATARLSSRGRSLAVCNYRATRST